MHQCSYNSKPPGGSSSLFALIGDLPANRRFRLLPGSALVFPCCFGFTTIASRRMATVHWCLRGGGCQPFLHGLHCAPGIKFGVAAFFVHLLWHQDKRKPKPSGGSLSLFAPGWYGSCFLAPGVCGAFRRYYHHNLVEVRLFPLQVPRTSTRLKNKIYQ